MCTMIGLRPREGTMIPYHPFVSVSEYLLAARRGGDRDHLLQRITVSLHMTRQGKSKVKLSMVPAVGIDRQGPLQTIVGVVGYLLLERREQELG